MTEHVAGPRDASPLALHSALSKGAGKAQVHAILTNAQGGQPAAEKDDNLRLPLHWACAKGSSLEVVQLLLEAFEEGSQAQAVNGRLPLHVAVARNTSPDIVRELVRAFPGSTAVADHSARLPLHVAVKSRASLEVVEALLEGAGAAGASVPIERGRTAVHIAASCQAEAGVVQLLLRAHPPGAHSPDEDGRLPLHLAVACGAAPDVVTALLEAYPEAAACRDEVFGSLPLHVAVMCGAGEAAVAALLEAYPEGAQAQDEGGRLPIHAAAACSVQPGVLAALVAAHPEGAMFQEERGRLPLHYAAFKGADVDTVRALLEVFADAASQPDDEGRLPLHLAAKSSSQLEALKLILDAFSDGARACDDDGRLPLHLGVGCNGGVAHVKALLEAYPDGAKVADKNLRLPVHLAARNAADSEVMADLLDAFPEGAAQADKDGALPLHDAALTGAVVDVFEVLLETYPDGAAKTDANGRTPLHFAVANGAGEESVEVLLEVFPAGASKLDKEGRLPLHAAAANHASLEVVNLLLEAYPEGAQKQDKNDVLPLHFALANEAEGDVVTRLLEAFPEGSKCRDQDGALPLHDASFKGAGVAVVDALIVAYPEGVVQEDSAGRLPLHMAVSGGGASREVVASLVKAYADGVRHADHKNLLPLAYAVASEAPADVVESLIGITDSSTPEFKSAQMHELVKKAMYADVARKLVTKDNTLAALENSEGATALEVADQTVHDAMADALLHDMMHEPCATNTNQLEQDQVPIESSLTHKDAAESEEQPESTRTSPVPHPDPVPQPDLKADAVDKSQPMHASDPRGKTFATQEQESVSIEPVHAGHGVGSDGEGVGQGERVTTLEAAQQTTPREAMVTIGTSPGSGVEVVHTGTSPASEVNVLHTGTSPGSGVDMAHPGTFPASEVDMVHTGTSPRSEVGLVHTGTSPAFEVDMVHTGTSPGSEVDVLHTGTQSEHVETRHAEMNATAPPPSDVDPAGVLFLERYRLLPNEAVKQSATSIVMFAEDLHAADGAAARVALKLTQSRLHLLAEVKMRVERKLGAEHVVDILRVHLGNEVEEAIDEATLGVQVVVGDMEDCAPYHFCIVMPMAEKCLQMPLLHDRFAGLDWDLVREISADLVRALGALHRRAVVHGNFKPMNVVQLRGVWKLIDLKSACDIGSNYGGEAPSTGYCPPEVAAVVADRWQPISEYIADSACDLWALGVVMYHMASGRPLWVMDQDDNVTPEDLFKIASWDAEAAKLHLGRVNRTHPVLYDLLRKLLEAQVPARKQHFPSGMQSVLAHPFFRGGELDPESQGLLQTDMLNVNPSLPSHQLKLNAQTNLLLQYMRFPGEHEQKTLPSLVVLLPHFAHVAGTTMWDAVHQAPGDWMEQDVMLWFVDPVSMRLANTNKGMGFKVSLEKRLLSKAMPYLKIGLTVLKAACLHGCLAFHTPDVQGICESFLNSQLAVLDSIQDETNSFISQTNHGTEPGSIMECLNSLCDGVLRMQTPTELQGMMNPEYRELQPKVRLCVQESMLELVHVLDSSHSDWHVRAGLVNSMCASSGISEWVHPKHKPKFDVLGEACLATEATVQPEVVEMLRRRLHETEAQHAPVDCRTPEATLMQAREEDEAGSEISMDLADADADGDADFVEPSKRFPFSLPKFRKSEKKESAPATSSLGGLFSMCFKPKD